MIRQTSTTVVPLTPDLAMEWATMPAWKGERPVRRERIEMLLTKLRDGLFHSPTWAVASLRGHQTRMNGQHSSLALLETEPFPQGLQVTIQEFQVDTDADLAELFDQFDNPQSARRLTDVIHAHAAIEDELADCPSRFLQIVLAGITQAMGRIGSDTNSERAALVHSHRAFIGFARRYQGRRHLLYQPVLGAMYLSWKRNPVDASEFWDLVASEAHAVASNPTRVLARFLTGEVIGRTRRGGLRWDRRAVLVKCLHAWNAYWKQQTTALKYSPEAPIPTLF